MTSEISCTLHAHNCSATPFMESCIHHWGLQPHWPSHDIFEHSHYGFLVFSAAITASEGYHSGSTCPTRLSLGFKYDSISMDALATSISLAGCFWWTLKVTWGLSNCRQRHIFSSFVLQVWESLVCHELQMISKLCPPFCLTYLSGVKFCDIHFFQCVWLKLS